MYEQINHTDLIAQNGSHYVQLAVRLLRDADFHDQQEQEIIHAVDSGKIHRNQNIAREWIGFVLNLFK
jgi:predicted O-linked N-acetylglucosamine transferase (SPINDLY family)